MNYCLVISEELRPYEIIDAFTSKTEALDELEHYVNDYIRYYSGFEHEIKYYEKSHVKFSQIKEKYFPVKCAAESLTRVSVNKRNTKVFDIDIVALYDDQNNDVDDFMTRRYHQKKTKYLMNHLRKWANIMIAIEDGQEKITYDDGTWNLQEIKSL